MISKNNAVVYSKILTRVTSTDIFWIFSFTLLTAVAAQISIPVKPVPFTLQTLMVGLSGAFLGAKKGAYTQLLYLSLGVIGLPVFAPTADGFYGFASLFGPTGGYLLAFPLAAFAAGYIVEKNKNYFSVVISMIAAEAIILLSGTVFLNTFYLHDWTESLKAGAIIFSVWTIIKIFTGAAIYSGIYKNRRRR
ncbi:MAG TPA: biotin transporter BioY [Ignavibacteriaceae bacterium]|jgi:biotin transport system substrate-specific component|nr:biotin transporter BioY [Ignavibacteriaceae bacterium]